MLRREYHCPDHKGVITWPKFISILLTIVVIEIGITTTISGNQTKATEKVDDAAIARDKDIVKEVRDISSEIKIMGKNITAICTKLEINEK